MAATSTAATAAALTTDDVRSQIEQTRAEMSGTIDAIQTRLSPARAIVDAKDALTDATVGRLKRLAQRTPDSSGRSVLETARAIPLPVALLATAVVGLVVRALNHGNRRRPTHATLNDGGERDRRERTNQASGPGNRRLVSAASAAAACWALWRAQTPASHSGNAYPARQEG
jgi:hypothetical protein